MDCWANDRPCDGWACTMPKVRVRSRVQASTALPQYSLAEAHLSMAPGEMCTQDLSDRSSVLVSGQPGTGGHINKGFALLLELLCKVSSKQIPPLLLYSSHMNVKACARGHFLLLQRVQTTFCSYSHATPQQKMCPRAGPCPANDPVWH